MAKGFQFEMRPRLLTKHLGADLYKTPASALAQLVDNSLDAGCTNVEVSAVLDDMGTALQATIVDNGSGISPDRLHHAFAAVGEHYIEPAPRDAIGTKGIGRFAVFRLAYRVAWDTVADAPDGRVRQRWEMLTEQPTPSHIEKIRADGEPTGTRIGLFLHQGDPSIQTLFRSTPTMKRELFVAFAAYLARYETSVRIVVNGEPIALQDYVMERSLEHIAESEDVPAAELHHFLMEGRVQLEFPNTLLFATSGATVKIQKLETDPLQGRKYLGLVDSPYLADLTSTGKSDFATWDDRFNALASEAASRALKYVDTKRGDRAKTFIEQARAESFYPYRGPADTPLQRYSQSLYDSMLIALEESTKISGLPPAQKRLVFALTHRLLKGEDDLASVLTDVLGLEGEEISKFADVLRSTTLRSMVATASLVVDRLAFLRDLDTILYGAPAKHVRERSQLHKILEGHSWVFGESYNLMTFRQAREVNPRRSAN